MKKYLILILLVLLTGCSQSVNLGAEKNKESNLENKVKTLSEKYQESSKVKAKYKLEKSAFIKEAKKDDDVSIELGDKNSDTFVPELTLGKWGEVSMKIKATQNNLAKSKKANNKKLGLLGASETELKIEDEKITHSEDGMDYIFYDIEPNEEHPEGAYEFEIQLNEKPDTNYIEIEIETDGLDFFYQPALTQEEIDEGAERPDNVIGSYAVYHSTKRDHIVGQTDYKTGKAMHIYYPYLIDANGWKVRAENFVIEDGLMKITLPQEFLDTAVYPILVDPTFGYTSVGSSSHTLSNTIRGAIASPGESGTATAISLYNKSSYSSSNYHKYALYIDSTNAFVQETYPGIDSSNIAGWNTLSLKSATAITAQNYKVCVWGDYLKYVAADSEAGYFYHSQTYSGSDPTMPTTLVPTSYSYRYSIYATYAGANTCTPPTTGDWTVQYSDNCYLTSDTYINGDFNLMYDGAGSFNLQANLMCDNLNVGAGASISAENSTAKIEIY